MTIKPEHKKHLLWLGIFILGSFFGRTLAGPGDIANRTVAPSSQVKTIVKEVCPSEVSWRQLKEVDDNLLSLGADGMGLCGQGIKAAAEQDVATMLNVATKVKALTQNIDNLGVERQSLLRELGL